MKEYRHGQKPEYRLLVAGGDFIRCRDYEEHMRIFWKLRTLVLVRAMSGKKTTVTGVSAVFITMLSGRSSKWRVMF